MKYICGLKCCHCIILLHDVDGKVTGRWWLVQSLGSSCCCIIELGQLSQHFFAFSFPQPRIELGSSRIKVHIVGATLISSVYLQAVIMWLVLLLYFPISFVTLQKAQNFSETEPSILSSVMFVSCCSLHEINFIWYNDDILLSSSLMLLADLLRKCTCKWIWYL